MRLLTFLALGSFFNFFHLPSSAAAHSIAKRGISPFLDIIFGRRKKPLKPKVYLLHKPPKPFIRYWPQWSGNYFHGGHFQTYSSHSPHVAPTVGPITHVYNSFTPHEVHLDYEAPGWIEGEYGNQQNEEHFGFEPFGPFEDEKHGQQHIFEDPAPEIPLHSHTTPPKKHHFHDHVPQHQNNVHPGSYHSSPPQKHPHIHVSQHHNDVHVSQHKDVHPSSYHSSPPQKRPHIHVSQHNDIHVSQHKDVHPSSYHSSPPQKHFHSHTHHHHHNEVPPNSHHSPRPTKHPSSHDDFRPSVLLNEIKEGEFVPLKMKSVLKRPLHKHVHHHTHTYQSHPNKHIRDIMTKAIYREDYPKKDKGIKDRLRTNLVSAGIKGLDHKVIALIRNHARFPAFPR